MLTYKNHIYTIYRTFSFFLKSSYTTKNKNKKHVIEKQINCERWFKYIVLFCKTPQLAAINRELNKKECWGATKPTWQ